MTHDDLDELMQMIVRNVVLLSSVVVFNLFLGGVFMSSPYTSIIVTVLNLIIMYQARRMRLIQGKLIDEFNKEHDYEWHMLAKQMGLK